MFGMFTGKQFFLLQGNLQYFKDDDPVAGMIVGFTFLAVIIFASLFNLLRHGVSPSIAGKNKGRATVTPRKFNAFTLHRIASEYGLDKEQTKLLEYIFRNDAVADPERVMKNSALLDRHFKRTYKIIERNSETEEDAQQRMVKLFALRNVIEAAPGPSDSSSAQLAENTPAVLAVGRDSYPVRVISAKAQKVITEIPRNSLGTPVRLGRGAKVTLSFFTKSSKGFSLEGQVMGLQDTDHGQGLQISHSGRIKPLAKRKYRRKQTSTRCEFFLVYLDDSERKKPPKLVVDKRRFTGSVLDISIGGCSLKTSAAIQVGSRLKITIDYDENYLINVLGQVLRVNRSGAAGNILHIKFLKVPRRAFNSISALVFGYNE
jgi:hypothetical protein